MGEKIIADNSSLGKALAWIHGELKDNSKVDAKRKRKLIEEASLKFDLKPLNTQYLENNLIVDKVTEKKGG